VWLAEGLWQLTQLIQRVVSKFESKLVLDLLDVILGDRVNNVVKDHAKLPTRLGGLGLSSAVMEANASYLSSWNNVIGIDSLGDSCRLSRSNQRCCGGE
jgi:hypothetical protein